MPRLKRKRRERKSDFEKGLAKFIADGTRKLWFYGGRFVALRSGRYEALLRDKEEGIHRKVVLIPRKLTEKS